jgi:hypothetical protein
LFVGSRQYDRIFDIQFDVRFEFRLVERRRRWWGWRRWGDVYADDADSLRG